MGEVVHKISDYFYWMLKTWSLVLLSAPKKLAYGKKFKFLLVTPQHGNLGDHAIAKAEKQLFSDVYLYELTERELNRMFRYRKAFRIGLKLLFGNYDVVFNGGGYIGTLWPYTDKLLIELIKFLKNNRIVFLPNTVFFPEGDEGESWLEKARPVYNAHKDLTLCVREMMSYEKAKQLLDDETKIKLIPDAVLSLDECRSGIKREGILLCLREDCEKTMSSELEEDIKAFANKNFGKIVYADMSVGHNVLPKDRMSELDTQFDKFRHAEFVVTDRLHGMIFAAVTGTPCAVFYSKSHKVKGVYDWCLRDVEYISNVQAADGLNSFYESVRGRNFVYDRTRLEPYYIQLKALVSGGENK